MFHPITVKVDEVTEFRGCLDHEIKCVCGRDRTFREVQAVWLSKDGGEPRWFAMCSRTCILRHTWVGGRC